MNEDLSINSYKCSDWESGEVVHGKSSVFTIKLGPIAIYKDTKKSDNYMSQKWFGRKGSDLGDVLCGERQSGLTEVEIFHLKQ